MVGFVAGLVLCTPLAVSWMLRGARAWSRRVSDPAARLSAAELQSSPARSLALAATGIIAVLLLITIGGAVSDIERAVRAGASGVLANTDLWINPGGRENVYSTQPFQSQQVQARLAHLSSVRTVLAYQESFLDVADQRVWVIGVPPNAPTTLAASQVIAARRAPRRRDCVAAVGSWSVRPSPDASTCTSASCCAFPPPPARQPAHRRDRSTRLGRRDRIALERRLHLLLERAAGPVSSEWILNPGVSPARASRGPRRARRRLWARCRNRGRTAGADQLGAREHARAAERDRRASCCSPRSRP